MTIMLMHVLAKIILKISGRFPAEELAHFTKAIVITTRLRGQLLVNHYCEHPAFLPALLQDQCQ
ncbi:hypothetical protein [Pseudomonas hunanensis]|uniref:hypothetical protein n=1 Tax=Pseudomonas hunanensis TaxID=1247546 RepID=UPI0030D96628